MAFGDRERGAGSYGPQTPGLRRGVESQDVSLEARLVSFEMTLGQHTKLIESMVGKVEDMDRTLTEVKVQMSHLVTKESCADGRRELAEDLKARMDGDREITGIGITVPKLWQQYVEATRSPMTPVPTSATGHGPAPKSRTTTSVPPQPKTVMYYVKAVSSVVSLVFAVITITFFAFKMITRLDQQQEAMQQQQAVMRDIQQNIKQLENTKVGHVEVPAPRPDPSPMHTPLHENP